MTDTEARARTAIALLREGLREFDFQRLAKASSELVRSGVLESSHGIELSKTVGFLRHVFHDVEEWEREHPSGGRKFVVYAFVRSGSWSAGHLRRSRWTPERVSPAYGTGGPLRASTPK